MKITIPAGAFHKAALKKRRGQSDEAEGSRKRPRSRSPPAPRTVSRLPTPPPPPRRSPMPSPPLPPRRSPTPLPPPRSPTPLPPPEPMGQTTDTLPEESRAPSAQPTENLCPPTTGSAPREAPETSGGALTDRRQKVIVGYEARSTASEPVGDKVGPVFSRPSVMNHPYIAEKLLSAVSSPAIREEIRRTNSRVLFREGQTAMLRVVNTFNHALALVAGGERRVDCYRREAMECRERATRAEDALKLAQAGEAERLEIVRSQARAEATAAQQQMRKVLERAVTAEGKLMAAEAELADVKTQLKVARSELKSSEEKVKIAEEVARLADIRAAEAAEAVKAADRKSAEDDAAARATVEVAEVALKAMENYRHSPVFVEEVAEAGADAYLQGFYCCRDKAVRVSGVESLKELEPKEGDLEDEEVRKDSASADNAAPPSDSAPAKD